MNTATLRTLGSDSALDYLRDALDLSITQEWKKGETRRRGGVYEISGFNADVVADAENPSSLVSSLVKEIRGFLNRCLSKRILFSSSDLSSQLDIGVSVGASQQFTASVVFSPENLESFSKLGLELSVSAYPIFDDAE
jgi:hypothetical protein